MNSILIMDNLSQYNYNEICSIKEYQRKESIAKNEKKAHTGKKC